MKRFEVVGMFRQVWILQLSFYHFVIDGIPITVAVTHLVAVGPDEIVVFLTVAVAVLEVAVYLVLVLFVV